MLIYLLFHFSLKPLDIEFMKQLHQKVNIVPVIAKSDVLTKKEVATLKKRVSFQILNIKRLGIFAYSGNCIGELGL